MWRDDIANWQKEIKKAFDGLKKLEQALHEHQASLDGQLQHINSENELVKEHEHALAMQSKGGLGESLHGLAKSHKLIAEKHQEFRLNHENLKRNHHIAMACWSLLLKALTKNN
jgi:hypothetical protein